MKKYIKGDVDIGLGPGVNYMELDEDGWPVRQIEVYGDVWWSSLPELGGGLGDQRVPADELMAEGIVTEISEEEFERLWSEAIRRSQIPAEVEKSRQAKDRFDRMFDIAVEGRRSVR